MYLNSEQLKTLEQLTAANQSLRIAKKEIEADLKKQLKDRLREHEHTQAFLAYRASQMGVPVTRIGAVGLGTTDPSTPRKVIALGEQLAKPGSKVAP